MQVTLKYFFTIYIIFGGSSQIVLHSGKCDKSQNQPLQDHSALARSRMWGEGKKPQAIIVNK